MSLPDHPKETDRLSSGTVFFMLQIARSSRDGLAEIFRKLERNGMRGSELHARATAATNEAELLRHALAVEFELRSRLERKRK